MGNGYCGDCVKEIKEIIFERNFEFKNEKFCYSFEENEEIDFTKLNENMNNITFKNYEEKSKEKEESKKYIENINFEEEKSKFNDLMEEEISKEYLVDIELNNLEKQEERLKNIVKISDDIFQEKTREEYVEQLIDLTETEKESIYYEIHHNPENFIKKEEIKYSNNNSNLFIQGVLSSFLAKNGINSVIHKNANNENENVSKMALQLIFNGEAFNQVINLHYSYGNENDFIILNDEEKQKEFMKDKQIKYAKILHKNIDDIIISKPRVGGLTFKALVKNSSREELESLISEIKKYEESKGAIIKDINFKCLLSFCEINPDMFDHDYDVLNDTWGRNEKRGPPHHLMDYDPPIGYKGYGLKVTKKYDNGDDTWLGYTNQEGEWYIAYHGTSGNYANAILKEGLKKGGGQVRKGDDNINELSKKIHPKVGDGVYCTPKISVADSYAEMNGGDITFEGKIFRFVFMLRVNPYKIRICEGEKDFWVFEGDSLGEKTERKFDDEVRPYRILLKEIN